jgi:hypothetical protein
MFHCDPRSSTFSPLRSNLWVHRVVPHVLATRNPSIFRTHNTLQREMPSFTQIQGPHGEVKPPLHDFLYYDAIPREEYKVLVREL